MEQFSLDRAVQLNRDRLEQKSAQALTKGHRWLVECRDLWDAFDSDAGVYFVECEDDAAVDQVVAQCGDDSPYDRLLGIFDLSKPLADQGGGITRSEWLTGKR